MFKHLFKKTYPISAHLSKRTREIRSALELGGKVAIYQDLGKYLDWMPPAYKQDLIQILKWVEENSCKENIKRNG